MSAYNFANQLYLRPLLLVPGEVTYEIFWLHKLSQRRGSDRLFRKLWSHFYSRLIFSFSMFSGSKTSCTQRMLSALWVTYLQAKNTFCNRKIRSVDGTENSLVEALHTFLRSPHDDENAGLGCWSADPLLTKELRLIGHNWWRIVLVRGSMFSKIRQI